MRGTGIIRFGPPNVAILKWLRHGLPLPRSPEIGGQLPGAGVQPVASGDGCRRPRRSYSTYPGLARRQMNSEIQPEKLTLAQVPFGLLAPVARSSDKQLLGSRARPAGSGDGCRRARRFDPMYPRLARCQPDPGVQPEKPTPARGAFRLPARYSRARINSFWVRRPKKRG